MTDEGGLEIRTEPDGVWFRVFVQPRASKNMIAGVHGNALKVKLTAPPVDNAANKMCAAFLAKALNVAKSRVTIAAGQTSRNKTLRVAADSPAEAAEITQKIAALTKS